MHGVQKGFSLIELLIVVTIILIIAGIAIPNLLRLRMQASQVSVAASLQALNTAAMEYYMLCDGYPPSLAAMGPPANGCTTADLIDPVLASGKKSGYAFTYSAGAAIGVQIPTYTVVAEPVARGATGQRSFFTDQTGVIRANLTGPADANNMPIG